MEYISTKRQICCEIVDIWKRLTPKQIMQYPCRKNPRCEIVVPLPGSRRSYSIYDSNKEQVYPLECLINTLFSILGSRTEETLEAFERPERMDVGQDRGYLCPASLHWPTQAAWVVAVGDFPAQPAEVRPDQHRGHQDCDAASHQDRRQGPHRPELSGRIHGWVIRFVHSYYL